MRQQDHFGKKTPALRQAQFAVFCLFDGRNSAPIAETHWGFLAALRDLDSVNVYRAGAVLLIATCHLSDDWPSTRIAI